MIDPRPRVFISSVMDGYAAFRDATAEGIRKAGADAVRAEDFPAAGHSPRNACLDGVQSADALVLILGERYGFVGPPGKAATEEEYRWSDRPAAGSRSPANALATRSSCTTDRARCRGRTWAIPDSRSTGA